MAINLLTFNGIQMGDWCDYVRTSIRRGGEPEIQRGLFKAKADFLELGGNSNEEDRYVVYLFANKGTGIARTCCTIRETIKDWMALQDGVHPLVVEGDTVLVDEENAYLVSIDYLDNPPNAPHAAMATLGITFWIKP